jgi:hypothetical protein
VPGGQAPGRAARCGPPRCGPRAASGPPAARIRACPVSPAPRGAAAPGRPAPPLAGEHEAADDDDRELVGAAAQQAQRRALHGAVAADLAGRGERVVQPQPGRGGRLGDHLRVVELVAAAEREPARREDERRGAALLGRQRRDPHRAPARPRPALRPDERQAQLGSAALGRRARALVPRVARPAPARERVAGRRAPARAREQALGALRGEVRPGRDEVEEERHARAAARTRRRAGRRAAAHRSQPRQRDEVAHRWLQRPAAGNLAPGAESSTTNRKMALDAPGVRLMFAVV